MLPLKEVNGNLIIKLENYGYLMFEPLSRTNENQRYSITLKVNDAMSISGEELSQENNKIAFEYEIITALDRIKQILNNIQDMIKSEIRTQKEFKLFKLREGGLK